MSGAEKCAAKEKKARCGKSVRRLQQVFYKTKEEVFHA
jgi:hypothetical protein